MMYARTLTRLLLAALPAGAPSVALDSASSAATAAMSPGAHDLDELRMLYRRLIDAENRHDIESVRPLVWVSPNALFVAKTATAAEGNWAGFWGTETVIDHLGELYSAGPFHIEPDYDAEKVVGITSGVAEVYAPVKITV